MTPDNIRATGKILAAILVFGVGIAGLANPPLLTLGHDLSVGLVGAGVTALGLNSAPVTGAVAARLASKPPMVPPAA